MIFAWQILCLSVLYATSLGAEPFECAEITKAVGSVIRAKTTIKTGPNSRIELTFFDGTIVRIGSNAIFHCMPGNPLMILEKGTMLVSSPRGAKRRGVGGRHGVTIQAGSLVVTATDFELLNVQGKTKAISLNGKTHASFASNPAEQISLKPGQMVDIAPNATAMPAPQTVDLETLTSTSTLMQMGPVPSQRAIEQNTTKQQAQPMPLVSKKTDVVSAPPPPLVSQTRIATAAQTTTQIDARAVTAPIPVPASAAAAVQPANLAVQQAASQEAVRQAALQAAVLRAARRAEQQAQQQAAQQAAAQQQAQQQAAAQQTAAQQEAAAAASGNQGNQGQGPQGNQGRGPVDQGNQGLRRRSGQTVTIPS